MLHPLWAGTKPSLDVLDARAESLSHTHHPARSLTRSLALSLSLLHSITLSRATALSVSLSLPLSLWAGPKPFFDVLDARAENRQLRIPSDHLPRCGDYTTSLATYRIRQEIQKSAGVSRASCSQVNTCWLTKREASSAGVPRS